MKYNFYALKLTAICVIVFILQLIIPGLTDAFVLNGRAYYEFWRFFTAIFLHGSLTHILFNGFALALFGSMLEPLIGGKRFLYVFFITGMAANVVSVNFYPSALGASGAIFGVIGALIFIRPGLLVWAFGLPMPIIVAGLIWAVGDFIGLFVPSDVGNIAHLSGMFFGLLLGAYFKSYYLRIKENRTKFQPIMIDERKMRDWEDSYLK